MACTLFNPAYPAEKPVYGSDDRVEMFQSDAASCNTGTTVAALFPRKSLTQVNSNLWQINTNQTLQESGWCADERFATQPTGATCSAFLIAPDKIATAAHCLNAANDPQGRGLNCAESLFVFDHKLGIDGELSQHYSDKQVYLCKFIIGGHDSKTGTDWRVAQLDRDTGRKSLPLYTGATETLVNSQIAIVGHPLGLPMKSAGNGSITQSTARDHFQASIDAYEGNSGSPVIAIANQQAIVIGLLSSGAQDSMKTSASASGGCKRSRSCEAGDCKGERVTHARALVKWAESTTGKSPLEYSLSQPDQPCLWCSDTLYSLQWQCPARALTKD